MPPRPPIEINWKTVIPNTETTVKSLVYQGIVGMGLYKPIKRVYHSKKNRKRDNYEEGDENDENGADAETKEPVEDTGEPKTKITTTQEKFQPLLDKLRDEILPKNLAPGQLFVIKITANSIYSTWVSDKKQMMDKLNFKIRHRFGWSSPHPTKIQS